MKIVCLGSGNVATHMAKALKESGQDLVQVWSKTLSNAVVLAEMLDAEAIDDLSKINQHADLYLIAVKDDAIEEVAKSLDQVTGLVVHTSGSTPLEVLKGLRHYGVLYPLQTFSKDKALNFRQVPLCIEAGEAGSLKQIKTIADLLSDRVYEVGTDQRKILHLAAVFACNFTNHLYQLSAQLLESNGLDFELLKPLIEETAAKIQSAPPKDVQTGPAVRDDQKTLSAHLDLMTGEPNLQRIYTILSESIKKTR